MLYYDVTMLHALALFLTSLESYQFRVSETLNDNLTLFINTTLTLMFTKSTSLVFAKYNVSLLRKNVFAYNPD